MALGQTLSGDHDWQWVKVKGTVTFASQQTDGLELDLSSGTGHIHVKIADGSGLSPTQLLGRPIRAIGICQSARTMDGQIVADTLLISGMKAIKEIEAGPTAVSAERSGITNLPTLTSAAEVHRLKREEAQRAYPVKMQGVVTCVLPEHQAFTIQDFTRGIYVEDLSASRAFFPQIGEFLEITGTTDPHYFAPIINVTSLKSLGAGRLPEPVRPTWDQLLNGSLDAQYVELQGIITARESPPMCCCSPGWPDQSSNCAWAGLNPELLMRYEDALVR